MSSPSGPGPVAAAAPLPRFAALSPRAVGIAAALVTILIWTGFIVIARAMALRSLLPLDIVLCRIVGAALVMLPWGWLMVRRMPQQRRVQGSWLGLSPLPLRQTMAVGLTAGIGYPVLAYAAFVYAPAAHGSVLLPGMLPLTTTLVAVWLLRERLPRGRVLGLALMLAGAALVGGASLRTALDGGDVWRGDLLFVCASSCWAFYAVLCRKHQLGAVPATIAVVVFAALGFIPLFVLAVAAGWVPTHLAQAPWGEIVFQALWQGVVSVVVSGISFTRMIQYFGPVRSTMMTALVPGLSALGAVLFLGEPLYWNLLAGLALVTLGIVVGVRAQAAPAGGART